jgi:hypothetical protein
LRNQSMHRMRPSATPGCAAQGDALLLMCSRQSVEGRLQVTLIKATITQGHFWHSGRRPRKNARRPLALQLPNEPRSRISPAKSGRRPIRRARKRRVELSEIARREKRCASCRRLVKKRGLVSIVARRPCRPTLFPLSVSLSLWSRRHALAAGGTPFDACCGAVHVMIACLFDDTSFEIEDRFNGERR